MSKTGRTKNLLLAMLIPTVFATGCDKAMDAFDKITLGKPPPENCLIKRDIGNDGTAYWHWEEADELAFPPIYAVLTLSAAQDDSNNIIAKRYHALASGWWLAASTLAIRDVVELKIPNDLVNAASATTIATSQPTPIAKYIENMESQLAASPCCSDEKMIPKITMGVTYPAGMYAYGGRSNFDNILQEHQIFANIHKSGFDVEFKNGRGWRYRFTNLGDGKIRIEQKFFAIFDFPFFALAEIDFKYFQESRKDTVTVFSPGK